MRKHVLVGDLLVCWLTQFVCFFGQIQRRVMESPNVPILDVAKKMFFFFFFFLILQDPPLQFKGMMMRFILFLR